jgi:hypothetical protein
MKGEGKLGESRETHDEGSPRQLQMLIISSHETPRCAK